MKDYKFQIFGSSSSQDVDIMVFVDQLDTIENNHILVKQLNDYFDTFFFGTEYEGKEMNANLAVVEDGMIMECFKGTPDECNNSLYQTYSLHRQFHDNVIQKEYIRINDEYYHLKLKRVLRFIIIFYSRVPEMRELIKLGMRGNVFERIKAIRQIDLRIHKEFPKKKEKIEDIYKVIAFQLAQTIMLKENIEVYTKEEASIMIPKLSPFLYREKITDKDLEFLQYYLEQFINICFSESSSMENKYETY